MERQTQPMKPIFGETASGVLWCVFQTSASSAPHVARFGHYGWMIGDRTCNQDTQRALDSAYFRHVGKSVPVSA